MEAFFQVLSGSSITVFLAKNENSPDFQGNGDKHRTTIFSIIYKKRKNEKKGLNFKQLSRISGSAL